MVIAVAILFGGRSITKMKRRIVDKKVGRNPLIK